MNRPTMATLMALSTLAAACGVKEEAPREDISPVADQRGRQPPRLGGRQPFGCGAGPVREQARLPGLRPHRGAPGGGGQRGQARPSAGASRSGPGDVARSGGHGRLRRRAFARGAKPRRPAARRAQQQVKVNQCGYTELLAGRDGVVSALHAEAGQVVSAARPSPPWPRPASARCWCRLQQAPRGGSRHLRRACAPRWVSPSQGTKYGVTAR